MVKNVLTHALRAAKIQGFATIYEQLGATAWREKKLLRKKFREKY